MIRKITFLMLAAVLLGIVADSHAQKRDKLYSWEKRRDIKPEFTDMVLCYGGSAHRTPFRWDKERFVPMVTYTDEAGKEHWMFDSFLFLEFTLKGGADGAQYSYGTGYYGFSAGKKQWAELIDYWFAEGTGFDALEQAVREASGRMGKPKAKRKVVLTVPDPILYKVYNDTTSTTAYWGELDGREMDFSKAEDRVAALEWYVDEVRKRYNTKRYRYIELAGFYPISEEIVTPDEGWNYDLKHSDEFISPLAEYVHKYNYCLCWIPYNRAAGYRKAKSMGFDLVYMQPNHYWDEKGDKSMERFFADIEEHDLAMEFEFEETLLTRNERSDVYRQRFYDYMEGAKKHGVYGRKQLSYYQGTNGFYELSKSSDPKDRKLYHDFCQFVINNPLRKQH